MSIKNIVFKDKIITYNKIKLNNQYIFYTANLPELTKIYNIIINSLNIRLNKSWIENSYNLIYTFISKKDIYGAYIGGSRALKINSNESDYDIIFILNTKYKDFITSLIKYPFPLFYLEEINTEQHAHFYFHTVDKIFKYTSYFPEWVVENHLNREENKKSALTFDKNAINTFFNITNKAVYKENLHELKKMYKNFFEEVSNNNLIWLSKRLSKRVTHLVIINCLLKNKPIDKNKIIELKKYAKENENRLLVDPPIKYNLNTMLYLKENIIELKKYFDKIDLVN